MICTRRGRAYCTPQVLSMLSTHRQRRHFCPSCLLDITLPIMAGEVFTWTLLLLLSNPVLFLVNCNPFVALGGYAAAWLCFGLLSAALVLFISIVFHVLHLGFLCYVKAVQRRKLFRRLLHPKTSLKLLLLLMDVGCSCAGRAVHATPLMVVACVWLVHWTSDYCMDAKTEHIGPCS